jgi:hypothetical protein
MTGIVPSANMLKTINILTYPLQLGSFDKLFKQSQNSYTSHNSFNLFQELWHQ